MRTVCSKENCTGCKACVLACPKQCISYEENFENQQCIIDESKCVQCGICHKVCQVETNKLEFYDPISWFQGWAIDESIRNKSSSGGIATELARSFLKNDGIVYSCIYEKGKFIYSRASTLEEQKRFIGSKYVKSDPKIIYYDIKDDLSKENNVLFIGLPCHVAGLKLFLRNFNQNNLYTVDLICHGTPSAKLYEMFVEQYVSQSDEIKNVQFRVGNQFSITDDKVLFSIHGTCDRYTIGFLNGLFYTDNCYSCKYAGKKRISDITLGDSWGSTLPKEEQKKGISLILCQTDKGESLLKKSKVYITEVDIKRAIANNHQLEHPVLKNNRRGKFFELLNKNKKFNSAVFSCYPYQCIKQMIKGVLIKFKVLKF